MASDRASAISNVRYLLARDATRIPLGSDFARLVFCNSGTRCRHWTSAKRLNSGQRIDLLTDVGWDDGARGSSPGRAFLKPSQKSVLQVVDPAMVPRVRESRPKQLI